MQAFVQAALEFLVKLATLGIIPKGWQTKVTAALGILVGVGMIAGTLLDALQTGQVPTEFNFQDVFGLLFMLGGGTAAGVGRKIDSLAASVEKVASELRANLPK